VLPFGDCIGIPNAHNYLIYLKSGSSFNSIHELLQYSSRIVTVAFVYDKSPEGKANQAVLECARRSPLALSLPLDERDLRRC
jgi:hypothetical protein